MNKSLRCQDPNKLEYVYSASLNELQRRILLLGLEKVMQDKNLNEETLEEADILHRVLIDMHTEELITPSFSRINYGLCF